MEFSLNTVRAQPGEFAEDISEVKSQLELINIGRYKGAVIRARAERLWLGKTTTKRSVSEEKRYAAQTEIKEIQYGNAATRDKKIIRRALVEHYRELLGHKRQVKEGLESECLPLMPRLLDDIKEYLEASISAGKK